MALRPSLSPARNETGDPFQDATFTAQRFLSECQRPRERLNHEAPTLAGGLGLRCEPGVGAADCHFPASKYGDAAQQDALPHTAHCGFSFRFGSFVMRVLSCLRPECGLRLPMLLTASERVRLNAAVKLPGVLLRGVAVFARWKMTKYKPQSQATSDACGRGRPQGVRPGEIRR